MNTTSPAFSIPMTQRKVFNNEYDDSPGPAYNTFGLNIRHKSLSYGIGMSRRTQINHRIQKTPAPCLYNPEKISKNIKITIPKSPRQKKPEQESPDPGFYSPQYYEGIIKGQTCSIGSRYTSIMDDTKNTPGPGAYEVISQMRRPFSTEQRLRKSKSTFNTTASRFKVAKETPGPGDYDLISEQRLQSPVKGTFDKSSKHPQFQDVTPGPGDYEQLMIQRALISKLGVTMSGRPKKSLLFSADSLTANAFATHDVARSTEKVKHTILSFKLGSSKRKIFQGNNLPSPMDYIKQNYKMKNTFRATISQSRRQHQIINENPGPGTYDSLNQKSITHTVPRCQSSKLFSINLNPGVGRYDVDKKAISKSTKGKLLFTSNRTNFVSKNAAGVGDYQIIGRVKSAITIPRSARFAADNCEPGPGDYHIPSSIGKYNSFKAKKN